MEITPLNNNLDNKKKKSTVALYGSCCCCCSCVLAPLGSLGAEEIIKKRYSLKGSLIIRALFNFLFFMSAYLIALVFIIGELSLASFLMAPIIFLRNPESYTSILSFTLIGFIFFILLFIYSIYWMKKATIWQRLNAVLFEFLLSMVLIVTLYYFSIFLFFDFMKI